MKHISTIIDSIIEDNEDMHDAMHDENYESSCTTCGHTQCTCGPIEPVTVGNISTSPLTK